jgi:competence ComEA-like helix-hairpin-helix protein
MRSGIRVRATRAENRAMKPKLSVRLFFLLCCLFLIASGVAAKKFPPAKPLDLNTATAVELAQLPGVGPSMAKAIVQFREKSGPFERVQDLLAIRGITERKLRQIRPYVSVSRPEPRKPRSTSRETKIFSA